jgi:hypothetical protein
MFDVNLTMCLLHVAGGGELSNVETNDNGIHESCVDPTIDEGSKCVVNIVTSYFLVITARSYFLLLITLSFCLI